MNYFLHIALMISLYVMLAGSINVITGYTGLVSLCHAAFYGIGAYTATLLMIHAGWGFLPSLVVAIAFVVGLSALVAIPSLRLKGDYFVLATLGFQVIVFSLLYNCTGLTNGPSGLSGIPDLSLLGIHFNSVLSYTLLSWICAAATLLFLRTVLGSPFGRLLTAIREDEVAVASLGKNPFHFKLLAFAMSAGLAATPGVVFAGYMRYIDPTSFTLAESIFILSILIIGGAGNVIGPIVGAVLMVVIPEALRFLNIPDTLAPNLRQIIYGLVLVVLMRYRSRGICGSYSFD